MNASLLYPRPLSDLEEFAKTGLRDDGDPTLMHIAFWPNDNRLDFAGGKSILVAGCGANAAARYAFNHPNCRITGIDVNALAMANEQALKDRHDLNNLELKTMALEDAGSLEDSFDLIDLTEVLHLVKDPAVILQGLAQKLKPEGVIYINVFGKHGSYGVSLLRDFFRQLGYSDQNLGELRNALRLPGEKHLAVPYLQSAPELQSEAGVYSLFLESPDAKFRDGFTVSDCLTMVDGAGLKFQGWTEPYFYAPVGHILPGSDFYKAMVALPDRERWQAMELFHGGIFRHRFYVCRNDRPESHYKIDFESDRFLDAIPVRHISQVDPGGGDKLPVIQRPPMPPMTLDAPRARLFNLTNGKNSIREILKEVDLAGEEDVKLRLARNFYEVLYQMGYALFRLP